jgi:hypothetical protein
MDTGKVSVNLPPTIVIIIPVRGDPSALLSWEAGPLPVTETIRQGSGMAEISATKERRATAFHSRVHNILYPNEDGRLERRAFRIADVTGSIKVAEGVEMLAVECLLYDDPLEEQVGHEQGPVSLPGFLCLHMAFVSPLSMDMVRVLSYVLRDRTGRTALATEVTDWLRSIGSDLLVPDGSLPPYTVTFATLQSLVDPDRIILDNTAYEGWDIVSQWTWLLSSWTPPERFAPPKSNGDIGCELALSSTWSARVLRDGTAFIAREQNPDGSPDRSPPNLALYSRTIYLDALLLGLLQARWLNDCADRIGTIATHAIRDLATIETLDIGMSKFRASMWWRAVAHGSHGDQLVTAFQEQHRLPGLLSNSALEISDLVRQARTLVERKTLESTRRTERIVSVLTVVGLPLPPVLTVWATLSQTWYGFLVALGVYAFIAIMLGAALLISKRHSSP